MGELLINTALLVVITLPICAIIGVALAWLTERTALPGRRIWSLLAIAPLAVPAFVQSYAWISLVPAMHGLAAGVFISVIAYFPFIYLPASAVLRRLDPGLEDAAASLGSPHGDLFPRGAATAKISHLGRFNTDCAAFTGGVWAVCHDPFRYLYHRHF